MPLTIVDNIVHQNAGGVATSSTSTAITVALAGVDTTDDSSIVFVWLFGESLTFATPSGWALITSGGGLYRFYRGPVEGQAGGESSWDFTPSATAGKAVAWAVLEVNDLDTIVPVDAFSSIQTSGAGAGPFLTSPVSSKTSTYDGLVLAFHGFRDPASTTPATWGSHDNSLTEVIEYGQAGTGDATTLSISAKPVSVVATYQSGATASRAFTDPAEAVASLFVVSARNAPHQIDYFDIDGAERGNVTLLPGTIVGGVSITTGAARSGTYGYRYSSTAAACHYTPTGILNSASALGSYPARRKCFRLDDLTDRELWRLTLNTSTGGVVTTTIRLVSSQIGLQVTGSTGTSGGEVLSDTTVTAGQWFALDVRVDRRTQVGATVNWAVDYDAELTDFDPPVSQTNATLGSGVTGTVFSFGERTGWATAVTAAMDTDDSVGGPGHNWLFGDIRVLPLKVDPAGTPFITGTGVTTNFGVMTANGTVAAWNATNARNAVDDIPPIAAGDGSRDAAVALLAHASDNAEFPMETLDLAANEVNVRGVRAHWWVWAASATTATIRVFVTDGTTTYTVYAEADPNADNTSMVYGMALLRPSATAPTEWTQPLVDGLAFRFGSNDATPDIGLDAMLLELAVVKAVPETLFGEAGEPIYVEAHRDPHSQALVGATVNNNSGDPVELTWEVSGVPDSSGSIPDGTAGLYVPLSADGGIETVGTVSLIPG